MSSEKMRVTTHQRNYMKELMAKLGGLTGEQLVKAAEPQDSPVHDLFTWNNRRAGHLYRLREAARILRHYAPWLNQSAQEAPKVPAAKLPFAVKVKRHPEDGKKWVPLANALEDRYMRHQLIIDRVDRVTSAIEQLLAVPELHRLHAKLKRIINSYMTKLMREKKAEVETSKKR